MNLTLLNLTSRRFWRAARPPQPFEAAFSFLKSSRRVKGLVVTGQLDRWPHPPSGGSYLWTLHLMPALSYTAWGFRLSPNKNTKGARRKSFKSAYPCHDLYYRSTLLVSSWECQTTLVVLYLHCVGLIRLSPLVAFHPWEPGVPDFFLTRFFYQFYTSTPGKCT